MDDSTGFATFVVRLQRDAEGVIGGVVERVRTGEKARFAGVGEIGQLIAGMLARDAEAPGREPSPGPGP